MTSGLHRVGGFAAVLAVLSMLVVGCSIDKRGRPWNTDFDAAICGDNACNDSIPCTVDECTPAGCTHMPNNLACTTHDDGVCNVHTGCEYPCTPESCFPISTCDSTECVNNQCVRLPEGCAN